MTVRYEVSQLDIDRHRWYFTKFSVERYRQEVDWKAVKANFQRTAEAVRVLLRSFIDANTLGDDELSALKATVQISRTIGVEKTIERIRETAGEPSNLEEAIEMVRAGTGIVGGTGYRVRLGSSSSEDLISAFSVLLGDGVEPPNLDEAAVNLLSSELDGMAGATLTPILCLLEPTRFPIINAQTEQVFARCFDIHLSNNPEGYLDSAEQFRQVREEFGFDENLRQLDYYCYWLREETAPIDSILPTDLRSRRVWQMDLNDSSQGHPLDLWSVWSELDVCSLGWDIGPLDELSTEEIETEAEGLDGSQVASCLIRFKNEVQPGQLVIAKNQHELLGIGVTQFGGYHYAGDSNHEATEWLDVPHAHVRPVDWLVVFDPDERPDIRGFDVEPQLLPHKTSLVGTDAFEGLRWALARHRPDFIPALAELEDLVTKPSTNTLYKEWEEATVEQPPVDPDEQCFILRTGSDEWEDEPSEQYHYAEGVAGYRQLTDAGTARVVYLQDGEFYATARVTNIERKERDGDTHYFADITDYEEITPVPWEDAEDEFDRSVNPQHSIVKIGAEAFESIVSGRRTPRFFWVNSANENWYREGGTVRYARTTEAGSPRNNQQVYDRMRPGDKVLVYRNSRGIVGQGTVEEEAHVEYLERRGEDTEVVTLAWDRSLELVTKNEIFATPAFEDDLRSKLKSFVIKELTGEQYQTILHLAGVGGDDGISAAAVGRLRKRLTAPRFSIDVPDNLYFEAEDELERQIQASLNSGKHIIFTGPPGTGKTKLATHICEQVEQEHAGVVDGYRFTTATAEWTTFDTIGGYVPNRTDEGDELIFQPRLFLSLFRDDDGVKNDWLVIDEINRSDIDKAFGQLFSVLSGDSVELPYERANPLRIESIEEPVDDSELTEIIEDSDRFPVTPSWRLLATMNTFDKTSLYELSYAFMRRFNFIHVGVPSLSGEDGVRTSLLDPDGGPNYATKWQLDQPSTEMLEETYDQLAVVWSKVNKHQTIGPSIMRDMLGYLTACGSETKVNPGPALTDAVIALVFPQLEGLPPQQTWNLIDALDDTGIATEAGDVDLELDGDRLERKAIDFFNLPPRNDE